MNLRDTLILTVVHQFAIQFGKIYHSEEFDIVSVKDTAESRVGMYAGGARCIYDIYTKVTPGIRIRGYFVNNDVYGASDLQLDRVTEVTFNDGRSFYTIAIGIPRAEINITAGVDCLDIGGLDQPCTLPILVDHTGTAILAEDGSFIFY